MSGSGERRALLMDYGGVLTGPIATSIATWEVANRMEPGTFYPLLLEASSTPDGGVIGALERGELDEQGFDREALAILTAAGYEVSDGAILDGLFAGLSPGGGLWDVVAAARRQGVSTALVSNSWGTAAYPRDRLAAHFDTTVISGEVGLRKPDAAIFELTLERLGVPASGCVFVDDNHANIVTAEQLGMVGVLHEDDDARTSAAVARALGWT